jgi:phosphohistidine phosphatase
VLRHAKAAAGEPGGDDHARPLTARGHRQGAALCATLPGLAAPDRPLPALVLCSTARRARQTAADVLPALGTDVVVEEERALYTADAGDVVDMLRLVPDDAVSVMVVGHNPTLHELAFDLVAPGDDAGRCRLDAGFPTAALAVVGVDVACWSALASGAGRLEELVVPER